MEGVGEDVGAKWWEEEVVVRVDGVAVSVFGRFVVVVFLNFFSSAWVVFIGVEVSFVKIFKLSFFWCIVS